MTYGIGQKIDSKDLTYPEWVLLFGKPIADQLLEPSSEFEGVCVVTKIDEADGVVEIEVLEKPYK